MAGLPGPGRGRSRGKAGMLRRMRSKASRLLVFLSLAAALGVAAVVGLEPFLENRKDSIRREIENAVGRPVAFETIRPRLFRRLGSLGITVTDVRVADDPRFAATPLIRARELTISLDWLSLLTGAPTVSDVVLDAPEIQFIRNEYGDINILAPALPLEAGFEAAQANGAAVHARDAKLYLVDRSSEKPEELRLQDLTATLQWQRGQRIRIEVFGAHSADSERTFSVAGTVGTAAPLSEWSRNEVDLEVRAASLPQPLVARAWTFLERHVPAYLRPSGPLTVSARVKGRIDRPRVSAMEITGALFGAPGDNARATGAVDFSNGPSWNRALVKGALHLGPVQLGQLRQLPWVERMVPAGLRVHGPLRIANVVEGPLDDLRIRVTVDAAEHTVQYRDWLLKAPGVAARLAMNLRVRPDRLVIDESEAWLHNAKVPFSGAVVQQPEHLIQLHVQADAIPLAGWQGIVPAARDYQLEGAVSARLALEQRSGPRTEPPALHGNLSLANVRIIGPPGRKRNVQGLQGELVFRGDEIEIRDLRLRSGLSDLRVHGLLFDLDQPTLHYSLHSDLLNLGDLTGDPAHRAHSFSNVVHEGAVELREGIDSVRGYLASDTGQVAGTAYQDLLSFVHWTPGVLTVRGLSVETLGGAIHGHGAITSRNGQGLDIELHPAAEGLDANRLLALLPGYAADSVKGHVSLEGRFHSTGKDWASLIHNLDGRGRMTLDKGVLADFNPVRGVLTTLDAVEGIDRIDAAGPAFLSLVRDDRTSFDSVTGRFTIRQGKVRSDDMRLVSDDYSIVGKGSLNPDGQVELLATLVLSPAFSRDLSGRYRNVRYLFDAEGISLPFRLTGRIPDITIQPDVPQLVRYMFNKLAEERPPRAENDGGNLWKHIGQGFLELLR